MLNENEKKSLSTVKNVINVLAVLVVVFFFCPTFLVSCSGEDIRVSAMGTVGGIKLHGEKISNAYPLLLICLLLPVAILVIMYLKKFTESKTAIITAACAAADFIIWLIFRSEVKKAAEEAYCKYKCTAWFVLNIIALIIIILLASLVVAKVLQFDTDLTEFAAGDGAKEAIAGLTTAVSKLADNVGSATNNSAPKADVMGYCSKCGKPLVHGNSFCTGCGAPIPESLIAEYEEAKKAEEEKKAAEEAARKAEEEKRAAEEAARKAEEEKKAAAEAANKAEEGKTFCPKCGAQIKEGDTFCSSCGAKIE